MRPDAYGAARKAGYPDWAARALSWIAEAVERRYGRMVGVRFFKAKRPHRRVMTRFMLLTNQRYVVLVVFTLRSAARAIEVEHVYVLSKGAVRAIFHCVPLTKEFGEAEGRDEVVGEVLRDLWRWTSMLAPAEYVLSAGPDAENIFMFIAEAPLLYDPWFAWLLLFAFVFMPEPAM